MSGRRLSAIVAVRQSYRCAGTSEQIKQIKEGPMTTAGQAFLFVVEVFCLTFATITLVYFADRLRSDFLKKKPKTSLAETGIEPICGTSRAMTAWARWRHVRDLGHRMILALARWC